MINGAGNGLERTMTDNQEPLSGQQVQALQKHLAETVARILRDVELRKFVLQEAVAAAKAAYPIGSVDIMPLAKQMHEFLTAAATDARI
jgi:hypothetical protein